MPIEIGPVQLIVFGFDRPKFGGGIAAELKRLKEQGSIRVIDALVVHKNAEGDVRTMQITDLDPEETERLGAIIGALIGLGLGGDDFIEPGAEAGMKVMSERGGHVFDPESWDVLEDIPNDSAAALLPSNTDGRSRCEMLSGLKAAQLSATSGSIRKTWSPWDFWRLRRSKRARRTRRDTSGERLRGVDADVDRLEAGLKVNSGRPAFRRRAPSRAPNKLLRPRLALFSGQVRASVLSLPTVCSRVKEGCLLIGGGVLCALVFSARSTRVLFEVFFQFVPAQ